MAPLRPLNHWMLHDKKLAEEFDEILKLTPYYDPVRLVESQTDLTFFAPLTTDVRSRVGNYSPDFQRNSSALYRAPMQSDLLIAGDNVARHEYVDGEYIGILMEQARTNKCENYNANPDVGLTNVQIIGAGAIGSRVNRPDLIEQAGLQNICTDANVLELDNRQGTDIARLRISGESGNTNAHVLSSYAARDGNSSGITSINYSDEPEGFRFENENFERISKQYPSLGNVNREVELICHQGARAWFILNQSEESRTLSSPIVTLGAAATRSPDTLTWPLVDSLGREIINDVAGMAAMELMPGFGALDLDLANNETQIFLDPDPPGGNGELFAYQNAPGGSETFRAYGAPSSVANVPLLEPLTKGQLYLLMIRWSSGQYEIGYKSKGVVTWGNSPSFSSWNAQVVLRLCSLFDGGAYETMGPANARNVRIWRVDNGRQWLEDFFSGVAN